MVSIAMIFCLDGFQDFGVLRMLETAFHDKLKMRFGKLGCKICPAPC